MTIHRFFVNHKLMDGDEILVTDQDVIHQMKNVLRLSEGDPVILLDGRGKEYHTRVKVLMKKESIFSKEKLKTFPQNAHTINLYFSILKKDKSEWVLQKCTELGVLNFIPTLSERTEKTNLRQDRSETIIKEAAEQSGKGFLPVFHETLELDYALSTLNPRETFCLDMDGSKISLPDMAKLSTINLFVGPEGGWSLKDKEIFKRHDIQSISLGDFILRAETASVAAVAAIQIGR